jgi:hypothetical protein
MKELSLVMATGPSDYGNSIYREVESAIPTPLKARTELSLYTLHEALKNIDYEIVVVEWLGVGGKGLRPLYW